MNRTLFRWLFERVASVTVTGGYSSAPCCGVGVVGLVGSVELRFKPHDGGSSRFIRHYEPFMTPNDDAQRPAEQQRTTKRESRARHFVADCGALWSLLCASIPFRSIELFSPPKNSASRPCNRCQLARKTERMWSVDRGLLGYVRTLRCHGLRRTAP